MGNMLNQSLTSGLVPNDDLVIVNHDQGTPEWLQWRTYGIGASEVAILLGISPYKTIHRYWLEKKGFVEPEDLSRNPNVKRGNYFEPLVRRSFASFMNEDIDVYCGESRDYPHRKVSFDGVITSNGAPVEIKCPAANGFAEVEQLGRDSSQFKLYEPQLSYQIAMTGAEFGYLVFYCATTKKMLYFKVDYDENRATEIFEVVDTFFEVNIKGNVEPDKDPERDAYTPTELEIESWTDYGIKLFDLKVKQDALEAELKKIKEERDKISFNLFKAAKPFKSLKIRDLLVTKVIRKGRFNYTSFLEDKGIEITNEDREKYTSKDSIYSKISLPKSDIVEEHRGSLLTKRLNKMRRKAAQFLI